MIYFDNAASTPLLDSVVEKMRIAEKEGFANASAIHAMGRKSRSLIEKARKVVATALNCSLGEVFFCGSATEANNTILKSAIKTMGIKRIITSKMEHPCVLNSLDHLKKSEDFDIVFLDIDRNGEFSLVQLEETLSGAKQANDTLVSIMYVNNELGNIFPVSEISKLCRKYGAYFHSDAVQAIGKMPVDLQEFDVDFLSCSAHKFHGPKGIGFMYIKQELSIDAYIHGGAQERNMRAGTESVSGVTGLAEALKLSCDELESRRKIYKNLKEHLLQRISTELVDVQVNGSATTVPHIVNLSFPAGPKADMLHFNLDINGVCSSSGSACSSGIEHDSGVLIAINHDSQRKAIRFSFSHKNTIAEIDQLVEILKKLTPTTLSNA